DRSDEAQKAYRRCIGLYESLRLERPARTPYQTMLASIFTDCPVERLRDPPRAIELAKKVLEVEPHASGVWVTLGAAYYRQSHWKAAVDALETALRQNDPDVGRGAFYLAMAYARQRDGERASRYYEQAVNWMETNQPRHPDFVRFRAEAREVLKI